MTGGTLFKIVVGQISLLTIPLIFFLIVGYALVRRVKVYESFVEGGKEGWTIFLKILPYIVAIFVAIGMFRVCGALDFISEVLGPLTARIGMPPETLPVALLKPLSGSGSLGMVAEVLKHDPNTFAAKVASTMFASGDTTFYIIAVYFGSVGITKVRHALVAGLIADLVGILAAIGVCHLVFK